MLGSNCYPRSGNAFVQTGVLRGSITGAFGDSLDLYNDGTTSSVAIGDFDARIGINGSGAAYFLGLSQVQ